MRLDHLEVHLNELFHDLNSPLSSMRLQLGLLREALRSEAQLLRRVESTERQLVRTQAIIDAFVSACALKPGCTPAGEVFRRVFERFELAMRDESGDVAVGLKPEGLDLIARTLAEGCIKLMEGGSIVARAAANEQTFVLRVSGRFDQATGARALRLSFVDEGGLPGLALATTRVAASAANGTLLLERDALVLRLPLVEQ